MSRKKRVEKKEISQAWLTTYSDMVTLILTFFVLLYSFSVIDSNKFRKIAVSLQNALLGGGKQTLFDYTEKTGDVPIIGEEAVAGQDSEDTGESQGGLYNDVVKFVEDNALGDFVSIKRGSGGIIIEFRDKILFDSGRAELRDEGVPALRKISELVRGLPNIIVIEGHTDNVPIHTAEFPSNWELSAARALKVLWYMTENRQINPDRFSIAAYGEYSPIASNDTPDGRSQNRRVNILIVTEEEILDKK